MAQAEIERTLLVDRDRLFSVITHYEDYPQFVDGVSAVQVERKSPGHTRVTYKVHMIKEISYVLDLQENADAGTVSWTLVESDFMKVNQGGWRLKASGSGKTDIAYQVEVEFKIPVPGMILNRLVKGSLPAMIKSFENRAKGA